MEDLEDGFTFHVARCDWKKDGPIGVRSVRNGPPKSVGRLKATFSEPTPGAIQIDLEAKAIEGRSLEGPMVKSNLRSTCRSFIKQVSSRLSIATGAPFPDPNWFEELEDSVTAD